MRRGELSGKLLRTTLRCTSLRPTYVLQIAAPHYRTISPPSSTSTSTSTIAFALGDNLTPNPSPTHLTAVV